MKPSIQAIEFGASPPLDRDDDEVTEERQPVRFRKPILLAAQILAVSSLLAAWLLIPGVRADRSLWILFLYCFPSEFLVASVPHEPVIVYFGQWYPAVTVAVVSAVGTVLTEAMNYSVISALLESGIAHRVTSSRMVERITARFSRAPFTALLVAGLTPVPFYPFRFLVVFAKYPRWRYLAAVMISRTPRFWLLSVFGATVPLSDGLILALFVVMIAAIYGPALVRRLGRRSAAT